MADARVSRKEQGELTRRAIVQAAVELYAEAGVRGTGLMAIGERAGVSHATVLYHFGSSMGLLLAVLAERDRCFAAYEPSFRAGGIEALEHLPRVAAFNVEHPLWGKLFTVLQVENLDTDDEAHEYFVERRATLRRQIASLLRRAEKRGEIRSGIDANGIADEILSFAAGAQIQYYLDPARVDLVALYERYTVRLMSDLTRGLDGSPPSLAKHPDSPVR